MRYSRLKWVLPIVVCTLAVVTSAYAQVRRAPPPPGRQTQQDSVTEIKELKRQIDQLMGKLPPNVQDELEKELAQPPGPLSRGQPPQTGRPLPSDQEAVKRKILTLKDEMDKLMSKLPPRTQAELKQELAQPPESPQKPGRPQPGRGSPQLGGTQLAPPRPGAPQPGSQQQPGAPPIGGTQPGLPQPGHGSPQFGRPQPGPPQPGTKHAGPPGKSQPGAQRPGVTEAGPPRPGVQPSGPQPAPQQPPPQKTGVQPSGQPALLIDEECAFVSSTSMGEVPPRSNVVPPLTVEVEGGRIPNKLFRWIEDSFAGSGVATRSGEIHIIRISDYESMAVREFQNAHISSVTFSALDANSLDPTRITVAFNPESIVNKAGTGKTSSPPGWPGQKGRTYFRVTLDGLPTSHVSRIESFAWSRDLDGNTVTVPELELTISMIDYDVYLEKFEAFVISGNLGTEQELAGSLELLAGNLKTVLATIELGGVTPVSIDIGKFEASKEAMARFKVRLNVGSMRFK